MVHQTIIPDDRIVTLSFTIPEDYVGKEVEIVAFVKQQETVDENSSVTTAGKPLSTKVFLDWIERAEQMPSFTIDEAKSQWEIKKARILQSSR